MDTGDQQFHANVELPCKMFREVESFGELAGTVLSIDTRSLLLRWGGGAVQCPKVGGEYAAGAGDAAGDLTGGSEASSSRCLSLRAKVVTVTDQRDGSQMLELTFRKAKFKDSVERGLTKNVKTAGWRM